MFVATPYTGFNAIGVLVTPAYIGQDSGTNVNQVHTFTNLVPARLVGQRLVAALGWGDASNRTIEALTIAGVSATSRLAGSVGVGTDVEIFDAFVPAGAAGDVVVDLSGANGIDLLMASLYTVGDYGYRTGGSDTGTDTAALSGIAVNANEYAIGIGNAYRSLGALAHSWTNLTERDDVDLLDNRISSASILVAAGGTLTVSTTSLSADEIVAIVGVYA